MYPIKSPNPPLSMPWHNSPRRRSPSLQADDLNRNMQGGNRALDPKLVLFRHDKNTIETVLHLLHTSFLPPYYLHDGTLLTQTVALTLPADEILYSLL